MRNIILFNLYCNIIAFDVKRAPFYYRIKVNKWLEYYWMENDRIINLSLIGSQCWSRESDGTLIDNEITFHAQHGILNIIIAPWQIPP